MLRFAGLVLLLLPSAIFAGDNAAAAVARWRTREKILAGADLSWTVAGNGRLLRDLTADFEARRGTDGGIEHHPVKAKPFAFRYTSRLDVTRHRGYDRVAYEDMGLNLKKRQVDPIEHATYFASGLIAHGSGTDVRDPKEKARPRGIVDLQTMRVSADTPMAAMLCVNLLGTQVAFPTESAPFLAGVTPLDLRGLKAESIHRNPQGWTVSYRFAGDRIVPGNAERASYAAEVTLADDGLPLRIEAKRYGRPHLTVVTEDVRAWRGVRVPARVALHTPDSRYMITQSNVIYTLREIVPSPYPDERQRNVLDPRPEATVTDWRLLGKDMNSKDFPPRGTPKRYVWKGRFPSLKELNGEANMVWAEDALAPAPPPAWPAYAVGVGLVGLIGGGIWLLARRKRR